MKLIYMIFIFINFFTIAPNIKKGANGNDYNQFQSVNLAKGKLIKNWTDKEKNQFVPSLNKRKFWGWNVIIINKEVEATFESEILFSFYNNGPTEMEYSKTITYDKSIKTSISSTGNISYKGTGTFKKFKHNLDSSINLSYTKTENKEEKQTDTIKIKVDPGYKAIIYMTGTARVTNGRAQRYFFWCKQNVGCFEYFTITSLYPRVKKVKIWF
mgnify:CR=1 FL=1